MTSLTPYPTFHQEPSLARLSSGGSPSVMVVAELCSTMFLDSRGDSPEAVVTTPRAAGSILVVPAYTTINWLVLTLASAAIFGFHVWVGFRREKSHGATRESARGNHLHSWTPLSWMNLISQWSLVIILPLLLLLGKSFSESLYSALAVYAASSWIWFIAAFSFAWFRRRRQAKARRAS